MPSGRRNAFASAAGGDARRGLARARALEHVAHVGVAVLEHAGEVGVARDAADGPPRSPPRPATGSCARPSSRGRGSRSAARPGCRACGRGGCRPRPSRGRTRSSSARRGRGRAGGARGRGRCPRGSTSRPAGRPSTTATRPGPWDSPAVVKRRVATDHQGYLLPRPAAPGCSALEAERLEADRLRRARKRVARRRARRGGLRSARLAFEALGLRRAPSVRLDVDVEQLERVGDDRRRRRRRPRSSACRPSSCRGRCTRCRSACSCRRRSCVASTETRKTAVLPSCLHAHEDHDRVVGARQRAELASASCRPRCRPCRS